MFKQWLLSAAVVWCVLSARGSAADEVTIGAIIPTTGGVSMFGVDAARTFELLPDLLAETGTSNRYRFVVEDGGCGKGNAALGAAQKLVRLNGIRLFVVGCSGEMLQAAPLFEQTGSVAICYACSHPDIRKLGPRLFRTYPDIASGIALIADELERRGYRRIALLTVENSFTAAIHTWMENRLGSQLALVDRFLPDERDYRASLLKLRTVGADALYLNAADGESYISAMRQLRDGGSEIPVFSYFQPGDRAVIEALGELQEGVVFFDVPQVAESSPLWDELVRRYRVRYGETPRNEYLLRTSLDAILALVRGVEDGGTADPASVSERIAGGGLQGVFGTLGFNSQGDLQGLRFELKRIVDGAVQRYSEGGPVEPPPITPSVPNPPRPSSTPSSP